MHTIVGRLTADAKILDTKDGRKVVRFTIAENNNYTVNGEVREVTNYYECAYWRNTGKAEKLKKGLLVEAIGRIGLSVWNNANGEAKGTLTLQVSDIENRGRAGKNTANEGTPATDQI